MPAQIKMNVGVLYTNKVSKNVAPPQRQVAKVLVANTRGRSSNLFDISTARRGCKSCGGG